MTAGPTPLPPATPATSRARRGVPPVLLVLGLAAMALLLATAGAIGSPVPGLPDAGAFTAWALPTVQFAGDAAAVVTVASLLAPVLTAVKLREPLTSHAGGVLRTARWTVGMWVVLSAAEIWLTASDIFAVPAHRVGPGDVSTLLTDFDPGTSLAFQFGFLAALLVWTAVVTTAWRAALGALIALVAVVPTLLTGHAASDGHAGAFHAG